MRRFLDTSTLVWLYDDADKTKHAAARSVLASGDALVISANVLGELFVALTKKRGTKPAFASAQEAAKRVKLAADDLEVVSVQREDVLRALDYRTQYQFSWWDALNWSTAVAAHCDELVGADCPPRRFLDGVMFFNPFE